jgi:hypothetical protein
LSGHMSKKKRIVLIAVIVFVLLPVALGVGGWTYHEQPRFCGDLCHIMDPYLESWNGSDYGAAAHAANGVTCLDCHEPTIQEQMNELIAFVKGDYTVPLEELEVSDEFCYGCHLLDEHENKEQVVARTAELERNPHDSHLIGEIACDTCHSMHKPSEDQCTVCHNEVATGAGWSEEVTRSDEVQVWDPEMDCTICKGMVPYVDSLENPALLGYTHAEEGLACFDCHDKEEAKQEHEEAVPLSRIPRLSLENEFCFGCHIENEHTSYEQIIERTADYVIDGEPHNPHDPHPNSVEETGPIDCYTCHKNHRDSWLSNGCYGCHHSETLESCINCHE